MAYSPYESVFRLAELAVLPLPERATDGGELLTYAAPLSTKFWPHLLGRLVTTALLEDGMAY